MTGAFAGHSLIWRIAGCPDVRTRPRAERRGVYSVFFDVDWHGKENQEGWIPFSLPSRLPGWHPAHICGMFCDGQDGNGQCDDQKRAGPPSDINYLTYEVTNAE